MTESLVQTLQRPSVTAFAAAAIALAFGYAIVSGNYLMIAAPMAAPLLVLAFLNPVLALAGMILFVPLEGYASIIPGTFTLPRLLGFVAFACFIANYLIQQKQFKLDASAKMFGLFMLWIFASAGWAQEKGDALTLIFVMFQLFVFYVMCLNLLEDPKALRWIILFYIIGSTIGAFMAVQNYLSGAYYTQMRVSSVEGMNPNIFGRMMAIGLLLSLFVLFDNAPKWMRTSVLCMMPALMVGLVLTEGRGAWLSFAVALTVILLRVKKTMRVYAAAGMLIVIGIGTGIAGVQMGYFGDHLEDRLDETMEGKDPTAQRLDIWKVGFAMIRDNPIAGVGFNNFKASFNNYLHEVQLDIFPGFNKDAHNIFLSIMGETGIIGLALFVGIFWIIGKWVVRAGKTWDGAISAALLVFTMVAGMSSTDYIRKWFWLSLIISLVIARRQSYARADA